MAIAEGAGATMFLVDSDNPGYRIERILDVTDRAFPGGHAEVIFEDCEVPRRRRPRHRRRGLPATPRCGSLPPASPTASAGSARRGGPTTSPSTTSASREAFGQNLGELGMVQEKLARSLIDIETSRLLIYRCAWALDRGEPAKHESSVAKAYVAEAVNRVVDNAVQVCGGTGVSGDGPLARLMNEMRPFRIYDGPTETHLWSIARRQLRARAARRADPVAGP